MTEERVSNLGPDESLLSYWTRQGVSLTEVQALIAQAETAAEQAQQALLAFSEGALSGVSALGQALITVASPEDARRILGITDTGDGTPGSGTNLVDDLTPVIPEMKAFIKAASMANALSQMGGVPTTMLGAVGGVARLDIDGDVVNFYGDKVILQLQGVQQQIAALSATLTQQQQELDDINQQIITMPKAVDLLTTPMEITWSGSWPSRPATPRPIRWIGGPSAPPLTGSTGGGGGMATIDTWVG